MNSEQFNIVLTGQVLPGGEPDAAVKGLARLFKIPQARAERLLSGRVTRLRKTLDRKRAESVIRLLTDAGVESWLEPAAKEPEAAVEPAAAPPSAGTGLAMEVQYMVCPRCGERQPQAEVCAHCEVVIAKAGDPSPRRRPRAKPEPQSDFPYHLLNRLLKWVFLIGLAATVWGFVYKDRLPPADYYDQTLLTEPKQTETSEQPFNTQVNGILYQIEPVADYELHGMVVSYHDSDAFGNIYHHKDWKDFINVRDLCVIWGENVSSEVYREMEFKNTTWTCWAYWPNREVAQRFKMHELSNNHVLADNPLVHHEIMQAEPGDHVYFKGMLARYSHSDGKFERGTSITRTDTGNGACETVFVKNFRVVQKANTGWRGFYQLSGIVTLLALAGIVVLLFVAPVRRS